MAYTELQENTKIKASVLNDNFDAILDDAKTYAVEQDNILKSQVDATISTMSDSVDSLTSSTVKLTGTQTISGAKTFSKVINAKHPGGLTTPSGTGNVLTAVDAVKNANGGVKLGNGLIVNWGHATTSSQGQSKTFNFPIAFSNDGTYQLTVSHIRSNAGDVAYPIITSRTKNYFSIKGDSNADNTYLAIGY